MSRRARAIRTVLPILLCASIASCKARRDSNLSDDDLSSTNRDELANYNASFDYAFVRTMHRSAQDFARVFGTLEYGLYTDFYANTFTREWERLPDDHEGQDWNGLTAQKQGFPIISIRREERYRYGIRLRFGKFSKNEAGEEVQVSDWHGEGTWIFEETYAPVVSRAMMIYFKNPLQSEIEDWTFADTYFGKETFSLDTATRMPAIGNPGQPPLLATKAPLNCNRPGIMQLPERISADQDRPVDGDNFSRARLGGNIESPHRIGPGDLLLFEYLEPQTQQSLYDLSRMIINTESEESGVERFNDLELIPLVFAYCERNCDIGAEIQEILRREGPNGTKVRITSADIGAMRPEDLFTASGRSAFPPASERCGASK